MLAPNEEALDSFLSFVKEGMPKAITPAATSELRSTQKKEMDLWHAWNTGGRKPKLLKPLFDSYKPLIQSTANKFTSKAANLELPTSAVHAELRKQFVNAVKSYDPKRGAQLNTWVQTHLRKASRFVKTYQNLGKIPESNIGKIREFDAGKQELADKLGYEPDTKSLADHLGWSVKRVSQMTKERRKDLPASGFESRSQGDPAVLMTSKELEAVNLLQYDKRMSNEERSVYEYVFGINGKPRLQPGEIAKKTGIHPSKVSRIRGKLKGLIQEAVEVL